MLINCTNHPYEVWSDAQRKAAEVYGEVVDLPFPHVAPQFTVEELRLLVADYCEKIESQSPAAVIVAGEYTFAFMLIDKLLRDGVRVICTCSRRRTVEIKNDDGTCDKTSVFLFEGFREYSRY